MTNHSATDWKAFLPTAETLLAAVLACRDPSSSHRPPKTSLPPATPPRLSGLSVELGLLALVMTPIILTAGIDLSVGSLLGLCAISFGKLWRDAGRHRWLLRSAPDFGAAAGGLNAAPDYAFKTANH